MNRSEAGRLGWLKSKETHFKLYQERKSRYQKDPRLCLGCDSPISYENFRSKFCDHSCAARFNNRLRVKKINGLCLMCGIEIPFGKKYCSHKHHHSFQRKVYIEDWIAGKESGLTPKLDITSEVRRYIIELQGNKCWTCGWSEVNPKSEKIPTQINHIDGNHKNNRPENLELLCPNCHSLTPTFMALNRGNGRKLRKR